MKKQMGTGRMRKFSGACLLVLLALFAIPTGQAMAKTDFIAAYGVVAGVISTDAPPGHGSVFPVTVSGQVKFKGAIQRSRRTRHGFKKVPLSLTKKQQAKVLKTCRPGFQLPFAVSGGHGIDPSDHAESQGTATTDAAGFFSTTIQFNTITPKGTQATGVYGVGLVLPLHSPAYFMRHELFGLHLVCWASPITDLTNGGAGTVHPF
jgi:hypothetical protein